MAAAMKPSRTADTSGMHAAATVAASAAAEAAAASTARFGIIRDQANGEQDQRCQSSENTTKHGASSQWKIFRGEQTAARSTAGVDVDQRNAITVLEREPEVRFPARVRPSTARPPWFADHGMTLRYQAADAAAKVLGVSVQTLGVRAPNDFEDAFAEMIRSRPDAILMVSDALTVLNRKRIIEFAAANRLPAIYEFAFLVRDGG
jgi:hypothetical protein